MSRGESTLTDLIAEAVAGTEKPCRKALAANPDKGCTVLDYNHCLCLASARAATAVVADWLESEEAVDAIRDPHAEPLSANATESTRKAHASIQATIRGWVREDLTNLAAEARKGADQ